MSSCTQGYFKKLLSLHKQKKESIIPMQAVTDVINCRFLYSNAFLLSVQYIRKCICGYREHILHCEFGNVGSSYCGLGNTESTDSTNDSLIHTIMACAVEYWLPNAPVVLFCLLINRVAILPAARCTLFW